MKNSMLIPALIGGLILASGSAIPVLKLLNCFCCAWLVLGGTAAAYLYVKDASQKISLGEGALLGALTGMIGSVLHALLSVPFRMFMTAGIIEQVQEALDRPEIPEEARDFVLSILGSGGFSIIGLMLGFLFMLVFALIFATAGGIIGVAIFEKRKNGDVIVPPPPMIPPPEVPFA
ncbi:MAG: hypothetical protein HY644_14155 [Acidobacteria bacterium]|nr:hypothetical protein [Acidobacteriota bacterium]